MLSVSVRSSGEPVCGSIPGKPPVFRNHSKSPTVTQPVIVFDGVGKKFCRSLSTALWYEAQDLTRKALRFKPREQLRREEFWALREVSFAAGAGECIGVIGPNGAGKTTLLRLLNGDYRPDRGRIATRGRIKSLVRLGAGLQPLLTGRENIYIRCSELGLDKRATDAELDGIVAFAGLEKCLDTPVRHYSDGMYARLEFSIATAVPTDILLVDEVLAVGDIAFQARSLERLNQLKRGGTAILFVSHSEMNIRWVADRCLLLFDGEILGFGPTDALFRKYYESVGYLNRKLEPLGLTPEMPEDFSGTVSIRAVSATGNGTAGDPRVSSGRPLELTVACTAGEARERAGLMLQFWNSAGLLLASIDSETHGCRWSLKPGDSVLKIRIPFFGLASGIYRIAGGFRSNGRWLCYSGDLLRLVVTESGGMEHFGLVRMEADFMPETERS
jgi:lipopolysaccharide transport system ATP-binding protein